MQIPHDILPAGTLRSVIKHFVLREGTDYGEREYDLEEKIAQVRRQLDSGQAMLLYSTEDGSVNIVAAREIPLSTDGADPSRDAPGGEVERQAAMDPEQVLATLREILTPRH